MIDSRAGALVDRTGTQPGGIGAGFYPFWSAAIVLACASYMGLFARWIGHYRWIWVVVIAVAMPVAIYATFEVGFRVSLPKSFLYDLGVLPF